MSPVSDVTLDEAVVIITETGETYRAKVEEGLVVISYQDNERWLRAGEGAWDGRRIIDCDADLGEHGFALLNEAILGALAE